MGKTLVTGATGFIGSHVARALAKRGDELRLLAGAPAGSTTSQSSTSTGRSATSPIVGPFAARWPAVERVFHIAGQTSLRDRDRKAVWDTNVRGTRVVLESALEARGRARRHDLFGRGGRRRPVAKADRRDGHLRHRPPRHHLRELEARGGGRGAPARRAGIAGDDRQSVVRARTRRDPGKLDGPGQAVPHAKGAGLRRRRAQHRRRSRCRGRASPRGQEGRDREAIHPLREELHARSPLRRPRPDLGRRATARQAARRGASERARACESRAPCRCRCRLRATRCARRCSGGRTRTLARSRSWASSRGPTRRPSRRPSTGSAPQLAKRGQA